MYYIYILYSTAADLYYVGYTQDPAQRLMTHNSSPNNTFTAKHRPWFLKAVFEVQGDEATAMKIEQFIKNKRAVS